MKKGIIIALLALGLGQVALAQNRYFTRDGHVEFFSETPLENIEATNDKMTSVVDFENGKFEFAVLIKSFEFEKALMEEHFNENYMESNDFPKASFVGEIEDFVGIRNSNFPPGVEMAAHGKLTIHGVTNDVVLPAIVTPDGDEYRLSSIFTVKPSDYDIEIPNTVRDNIAQEIKVTVSAVIVPLKK
ncbi:MAG: YceI family protein [Flavobacteriales bacterium]|nr:YceI family protein [Flavobacteriales bacterium]